MPLYKYKALNSTGNAISGIIDADDNGKATSLLKEKGFFLTEPLMESGKVEAQLFGRLRLGVRPGLKELSSVTYQMRTLLSSGLPMVEALTILVDEEKNTRLKTVLADVRDSVKEGGTIAAALSRHPDIFNEMYVNLVEAGDIGGMLEDSLGHLSGYLERQERVVSRVRAAMTYPLFMTFIGIVILSYLFTSVIPKVVTVFHGTGKALPLPTIILVGISGLLSAYWHIVLVFTAVALYWGHRFVKKDKGRKIMERLLDNLPYISATLQSMYMVHFSRTMDALLRGGVPISKAIAITSRVAGHGEIRRTLSDAEKAVLEGKTLTMALKDSPYFPQSVVSLIRVGETGGNLEESFARIGAAKEKELDSRLETLLTLLEPMMILFMGAVVGFIVLAILLPIFEMSSF
jgi:general secretion pathway protein F